MPEKTQEQLIKEHVTTLPKPVKDAIASFDWTKEVFDVGRKYSLHVDNIGEIETEVMLVVLGLISPKDFYDQMVSRIGLKEDLALNVAAEINDRVFVRIREFVKNYYAKESKKDSEIQSSEKSVLRSAGISLGDEPEALHMPPAEVASAGGEKPIKLPLPPDVKASKPTSVTATPTPAIPDIASKLQNSAVFKNKSSNYLDPYREPVE